MNSFEELNLNKFLRNALEDVGFEEPTAIQLESFGVVSSGRDVVGIAQTGTGKTIAYLLPILNQLKFSKQKHPRVLIIVPTRELVLQVVNETEKLTAYMNIRIGGVYGGVNMNNHKELVLQGLDILVATPGRLVDLVLNGSLRLKSIMKLVIDEVDEMLHLGFRPQLIRILDLLPAKRQNIMYSATITKDVSHIIDDFFANPVRVTTADSGTPLVTIEQRKYEVPNFNSKIILLESLLEQKGYSKILIFAKNKKFANLLFDRLEEIYGEATRVIHSNKSQNYRIKSIKNFEKGSFRILVATDLLARGIDIEGITHVINFDIPDDPESYMHRIGRTGRAKERGIALNFVSEEDASFMKDIERYMNKELIAEEIEENVVFTEDLITEEIPVIIPEYIEGYEDKRENAGPAFHEKKEKNKKVNLGGSYKRKMKQKYKKPKTRGQKRK